MDTFGIEAMVRGYHLLVRRNDGGRRYFYRQWTLRIRQFVVRVLLEVAVEGHLERKEAGSELAIIRVP